MTLWKRAQPTVADKQLLAQTQETAAQQAHEAHRLLGTSRALSEILRRSQEKNHYAEALDEVFGGKRKRKEE